MLSEILSDLSVINRDDGRCFTRTDRLDAIARQLWRSEYRRINSDGLFNLYSRAPLDELPNSVFIVSSHVDCVDEITHCFTRTEGGGLMRGTYDNAITNAAALYAMLSGGLPDDVLFCFTGDEEKGSRGAKALVRFMKAHNIGIRGVMVTDVTDMGWREQADFTVENNFWSAEFGRRVVALAEQAGGNWRFVPEDPDDIPSYVSPDRVIHEEAEEDESWMYDELSVQCFSLCLPVEGVMHSDAGVLARVGSFYRYAEAMKCILGNI